MICNKCNTERDDFRRNAKQCRLCVDESARRKRQNAAFRENPDWNYTTCQKKIVRSIIDGLNKSKYIDCDGARLRDWLRFQSYKTVPTITAVLDPSVAKKWVVAYVIPCELFLDGEYPKDIVLSWINIQPVSVEYSKSKHMNVDKEQMKAHLRRVKKYCKSRKITSVDTYIKTLKTLCETP
jgi:hypothetical protein